MPTLYSYIVATDRGFAPNPFFGYCTLACCKPQIRRRAQAGDYIVGIGPKKSGNHVVYVMRVSEKLSFEEYWRDSRFLLKRPNGVDEWPRSLGDNIYHRSDDGHWIQEESLCHGGRDIRRDVRGGYVLIGDEFVYWGGEGPPLPPELTSLVTGRAFKSASNSALIPAFEDWRREQLRRQRGQVGAPTDSAGGKGNLLPLYNPGARNLPTRRTRTYAACR